MKGLTIKSPWIEKKLEGKKTWEIRGSNTNIRGTVALIRSGSGTVVGTCELVDVVGPLSLATMRKNTRKHGVKPALIGNKLPYKKTYAWVLSQVRMLKSPVPYKHPTGAVTWVNLTPQVTKKVLSKEAVRKFPQKKTDSLRISTDAGTFTQEILRIVSQYKEGVDVFTLMKRTGFDESTVRNIISRTCKQGKIKRVGRGLYVGA